MLLEDLWTLQDLSGRPHLSFDVNPPSDRIGTYDTQLLEHFFQSLANTSGMTLHIRSLRLTHGTIFCFFRMPDGNSCIVICMCAQGGTVIYCCKETVKFLRGCVVSIYRGQ